MLLAEGAAAATKHFSAFDVIILLFTLIIAVGLIRQIGSPRKNKVALGFGTVSLVVLLAVDVLMVMNWMGILIKS